ncbi:MAG: methylcobamide:CoM methyltransferase MtaA [Candidatus Methylarchaceae archaeon HK01B]|nr:methylcobamide:CoM methyltransferase MtaA [Candidatus Methylarchaceae archaeon HK01B]
MLREPVDYTPAVSVTQLGMVEAMESLDAKWPEAHTDPQKMATLGASLWELIGIGSIRIPFCLTVQAEALGSKVRLGTINIQPQITEPLITSADQLKIPEDFLERGRIPVVLEVIKILKKKYGDKLPILVGYEGPMTLAGHLVSTEKFLVWLIRNRDEVKEILERATEANILYTEALFKAGADVVVPCDPNASPDLIPPPDFKEFMVPCFRHLTSSVKGYFVLHICGKTKKIIKDMAETGVHALSVEDKVDIREAKEDAGDKVSIIGNVSTSKTIFMGKPEEVKEESKKALEAGVDLLAPSCGIPPISPLNNIKAMVDAVKEYYNLPS